MKAQLGELGLYNKHLHSGIPSEYPQIMNYSPMKSKFFPTLMAAACLLAGAATASAADDGYHPKSEVRAAWMTTVRSLDFPLSVRAAGVEAEQLQKAEVVKYLDYMKSVGINCVFFHARPDADRFYAKNTYGDVTVDEPWSVYLTGQRGLAPTYDPLQFWIDEAHKRGMELHAWLNPYRYCNSTDSKARDDSFNPYTTPEDKRAFDAGLMIRHYASSNSTTYIIYNPGDERTIQRIADVCYVLSMNYDLDGILFDDYFYPDGIARDINAPDYEMYLNYKGEGGKLTFMNWRRDNVNRMVKKVYTTIKDAKPFMRFGISPAGAAGMGLKAEDGLPPLSDYCRASDWQYNGIASDPIAWLRDQSIDYVSPQLYWRTDHATNPFGPMSRWWAQVSAKFERHMFPSMNMDKVTVASNLSTYTSPEELCNQITLSRKAVEEFGGEPGVVFFRAAWVDGCQPNAFTTKVVEQNFSHQALMPEMTWQTAVDPGAVTNISRYGNTLTWRKYDGYRYSVYAVPSDEKTSFDRQSQYLLGFTYTNEFAIPEDKQAGYDFAVCVYDRGGHEFAASFAKTEDKTLAAPAVTAPQAGKDVENPVTFAWNAVQGAEYYIVEVAADAQMEDFIAKAETTGTECLSTEMNAALPGACTLYCRVHAVAPGYNDGVSEIVPFKINKLTITSPSNGATEQSLTPVIEWNTDTEVTVQISETTSFSGSLVVDENVTGTSFDVPEFTLAGNKTYYCRLVAASETSDVIEFRTAVAEVTVPGIAHPSAGGVLYSDEYVKVAPAPGAIAHTIEVSMDEEIETKYSYVSSNISPKTWCDDRTGSAIRIIGMKLIDGEKYYVHARAVFLDADGNKVYSPFSDTQWFIYNSAAGITDVKVDESDAPAVYYNLQGVRVDNPTSGVFIEVRAGHATKRVMK